MANVINTSSNCASSTPGCITGGAIAGSTLVISQEGCSDVTIDLSPMTSNDLISIINSRSLSNQCAIEALETQLNVTIIELTHSTFTGAIGKNPVPDRGVKKTGSTGHSFTTPVGDSG